MLEATDESFHGQEDYDILVYARRQWSEREREREREGGGGEISTQSWMTNYTHFAMEDQYMEESIKQKYSIWHDTVGVQ